MVVRAGKAMRRNPDARLLLAYSGKREVFVEHVDIARVIQDACELVRATMPKNVQLRWNADDIPRILTSPAQVQQLVMNLIINAAESIGEQNGVVNVGAKLTDVPKQAVANILGYEIAAGEYIELIVSDTGCGMSEEVREKSVPILCFFSATICVITKPRSGSCGCRHRSVPSEEPKHRV